jgi:uncharacterized protein (DUF3820 family)
MLKSSFTSRAYLFDSLYHCKNQSNNMSQDDTQTMPFGKYKGKLMSNISAGYLLHLYDKMEWFRGAPKNWVEQRLEELRKQAQAEKGGASRQAN